MPVPDSTVDLLDILFADQAALPLPVVARHLGLSPDVLTRARRQGRLAVVRVSERRIVITRQALANYLDLMASPSCAHPGATVAPGGAT